MLVSVGTGMVVEVASTTGTFIGECSRPTSRVPLQAVMNIRMRTVDKMRDFMGPPNLDGICLIS
jgi:hypothetical protein